MINSGFFFVSGLALLLSSVSLTSIVMSAPISDHSPTPEITFQDQILRSPASELFITNLATSKALKDTGSGLSSEVYSINSAILPNVEQFTFMPKWTTDNPSRLLLKSNSSKYLTIDHKYFTDEAKANVLSANLSHDDSNSWSYSLDGMNVIFKDSYDYYLCASDPTPDSTIIGNKRFSDLCTFSVKLLNPVKRSKVGSLSSNGPKGFV